MFVFFFEVLFFNKLSAKSSGINYSGANSLKRLSSGKGASTEIKVFDTGWTNSTLCAKREMLPSGLLRLAPYFKSPLIGHPIAAN